MDLPLGYLCLLLHAHLPFVRHPEYDDAMEERWLYQALTESYIPVLDALFRLVREGVPYRLSVSLSPPLIEMLADDLLKERYKRYVHVMLDLCDKEATRLKDSPETARLARMYRSRFEEVLRLYTEDFGEDIAGAFRKLRSVGAVDLLTSAATHAYLPLLMHKESMAAQIKVGVDAFKRRMGFQPDGFWLPECAYTPEAEPLLAEAGIKYFILETHGILCASPRPKFGFHAPVATPAGVYAFGRDPECGNQVWSAEEGYPGDGAYREFHRDIGYDLPAEYLGKALPGGFRTHTGLKYHRVTDRRSEHKAIYEPEKAVFKAKSDAGNFVFWRNKEAEHWSAVLGRPSVMVAPFDAELFGHWWYEGPLWLEETLRKLADPSQRVRAATPGDCLSQHSAPQVSSPAPSSWGYKGYSEVWLDGRNSWIYRHLHACQEAMSAASRRHAGASGETRRGMNQAFRELLLAQSSDWPFIIASGTVPRYAEKRFRTHIGRFRKIISQVDSGDIDPVFLNEIEARDNIFPELDFASFPRGE